MKSCENLRNTILRLADIIASLGFPGSPLFAIPYVLADYPDKYAENAPQEYIYLVLRSSIKAKTNGSGCRSEIKISRGRGLSLSSSRSFCSFSASHVRVPTVRKPPQRNNPQEPVFLINVAN